MPRKSFSELTPEEVLMLAIDVEGANGTRLRMFADLFSDYAPDAALIFSEIADDEDLHKSQLEMAYEKRFGELSCTVTEEDVLDPIETFDIDDAEHTVFDNLTMRRALETVLASEQQAEDFYRKAMGRAVDSDLGELYRQLAEFEDGHVQWIESRLDALGEST
jgi:rubrerythrin